MSEIATVASDPPQAPRSPGAREWQSLPPNSAVTAMLAGAAWGFFGGVALALTTVWPLLALLLPRWTAFAASIGAALLLLAWNVAFAYWLWQSTSWRLDDAGLSLRRGIFWRREVLVPRTRVQHLDIERGPIERRYGIATLVVHTAGTRHHALRIPGLGDADAVALRDALVPASALHDDVL